LIPRGLKLVSDRSSSRCLNLQGCRGYRHDIASSEEICSKSIFQLMVNGDRNGDGYTFSRYCLPDLRNDAKFRLNSNWRQFKVI